MAFPFFTKRWLNNILGFTGKAGSDVVRVNDLINVSKDIEALVQNNDNVVSPLLPTQAEKDALDASSSPSSTNPYITLSALPPPSGVTTIPPLVNVGTSISTLMNTNRLIGRYSAGAGVMEEIKLGTNLALTGDTLNASGGGGGVASVSGTANRITSTGGANPIIDIGTDVVTLTGAQALSNKTGLISQWTNDSGYLTSATIPLTATQIPYGDGANLLTSSANFTKTAAKVTFTGDGTGVLGSLYITRGDVVNQYIVLHENVASPNSAYLTFKSSGGNAIAMGATFAAGVPTAYIFTDAGGVPLNSIDAVTGANTIANLSGVGTRMVTADAAGVLSTAAVPTGTVTIVSVVSANGFAGTVATDTTTPAITLTTTITGVLKGNGTAISAATAADITAFLLTGYVSGAGVVAATDSILQAIQKLNGNIGALVTGVSSVNGSTGAVTLTLASAQFANQGTTTTVLHGNAAGDPSWGAVVLTTDVSGTLPIANGGTNATTAAAALVNLGIVTLKVTTGTQTTTAATAQDITGLSGTFAASTVYSVNGMIKIGCNNTGGVVMACTIPSGTMSLEYFGLSSSGGNNNSAEATASGTLTTTARAFCTLNSSAGYVWVKGTITTGVTSGTIKFQYASVTAGQTSSVFQEGTFIQLTVI